MCIYIYIYICLCAKAIIGTSSSYSYYIVCTVGLGLSINSCAVSQIVVNAGRALLSRGKAFRNPRPLYV